MVAIPQWLRTRSDDEEVPRRPEWHSAENARGQTESNGQGEEIPIFCAGGCGEVVGYLSRAQSMGTATGYENWCAACQAADIAKKRFAEPEVPLANTDELAGLREPSRNLGWLRAFQVAAVALLIAGSVAIAMGRVAGIYLGALGTLGWLISIFAISKLRN